MAERLAFVVDLGSTALKVGVATLGGELLAVEQAPLATDRSGSPRSAVQDPAQWWRLVLELGRAVLADLAPQVVAVSCTGQWASTVPVDAAGHPTGACLLWQDARGAEHARERVGGPLLGYAPLALATWVRRTAGIPSIEGGDPVSHMLHLERDDPAVAAASRFYVEPVDYLGMRFTRRAAATPASMSAAWLIDVRRQGGNDYDPLLVRKAGIDPGKLPPLLPTGSVLGPVAPEVATELGLGSSVPVICGMPDLHTAALGTGSAAPGQGHLTIGTTSWVSAPVARKKTDALHSIATVPGLDPASFLVANNQEAAGLCLTWLAETLRVDDRARSYAELLGLAATAPAGSGGVLFTPWIKGERSPVDDRGARGGWHNVSVRASGADLVRAVLEGVALNSRWLHRAVERFVGGRLDPLRICGGGAQSDLWCQIYADVLDRTIERVQDPLSAGLRGAALLAALALGETQVRDVRELVAIDRSFTPDPAARATYDRLYAEFPRVYRAERRLLRRLNRGAPGQ